MNSSQVVLTMLGSGSVVAVLSALVTGIFNRRKLGADATEIITKAASSVVERLEGENERFQKRIEVLERQAQEKNARDVEWFRVLQLHAAWDHMAVARLRDVNVIDLPNPPPLYPPGAPPSSFTA